MSIVVNMPNDQQITLDDQPGPMLPMSDVLGTVESADIQLDESYRGKSICFCFGFKYFPATQEFAQWQAQLTDVRNAATINIESCPSSGGEWVEARGPAGWNGGPDAQHPTLPIQGAWIDQRLRIRGTVAAHGDGQLKCGIYSGVYVDNSP